MTGYRYLIPIISVSPPTGYILEQVLPLDKLRDSLGRSNATLRIARRVVREGETLLTNEQTLSLVGGEWQNTEASEFALDNLDGDAWIEGGSLAFLETQIDLLSEGFFPTPFSQSFYVLYSGPGRKSFVSDNALKYGNTVTIQQIDSFGQWLEGYPACEVDPDRDTDESIILINPFARPAVVSLECEGGGKITRRKIDAQSAVRIACSSLLDPSQLPWSGQVFVSGRNRLVVYFCKHSLADPGNVTTLEHSDPYRGEDANMPFSKYMRRRFGGKIKSLLGI